MKNISSFYRYATNCYASCRYVIAITFVLTIVGCSRHDIREPVTVDENSFTIETLDEERASYKRASEGTQDPKESVVPESVQAPADAKAFENLDSRIESLDSGVESSDSRIENDRQKETQVNTKPEGQDQKPKALQELYSVDKPKKDPSLGDGSRDSEARQQQKNEQKTSKQKNSQQKNNEPQVSKSPGVRPENNLSSKKTKLDEKLADDKSRLNKTEANASGDTELKMSEDKGPGDKGLRGKELEDKAGPEQQKLNSQVEALSANEGEKNELEETKRDSGVHPDVLHDDIGRHEKGSHSHLTHEDLDHTDAEYTGPHTHEGYFHGAGDHKKLSKPRWNLQRRLK